MMIKPPIEATPETQINQSYSQKTQNREANEPLDPEIVDTILNSAGLAPINKDDPNELLKASFIRVGANLDEVARNIYNISCRGESENARLNAARFIAEIHGVKTKIEEIATGNVTSVTINVIGSENKTLVALTMPQKFELKENK